MKAKRDYSKKTVKDFLGDDGVLYCSSKCAMEGGAKSCRAVRVVEFYDQHTKGMETGDHWGYLCPVCELEYNCASAV